MMKRPTEGLQIDGFTVNSATNKVSGAIVGAGTVLTSNDVMRAREAGATFIVTPGLSASAADRRDRAEAIWASSTHACG